MSCNDCALEWNEGVFGNSAHMRAHTCAMDDVVYMYNVPIHLILITLCRILVCIPCTLDSVHVLHA